MLSDTLSGSIFYTSANYYDMGTVRLTLSTVVDNEETYAEYAPSECSAYRVHNE